jgi:hypothetical protein
LTLNTLHFGVEQGEPMAATTRKRLIFVSCGQVTDEEKALGRQVCSLVVEMTPHKPYFAENQNTLESFTNNILGSLDDAVGLIAVMHPRGVVTFPNNQQEVRGSVWIERKRHPETVWTECG